MAYDKSVFDGQIASTIRAALDLQARHDHFKKSLADVAADTLTAAFAAAATEMQYLAGGGGPSPITNPYGASVAPVGWWNMDSFVAAADTDAVTSWPDLTTNAHNLSSTYPGSGTTRVQKSVSGFHAVRFSSSSLENTAFAALESAQHATVFAVFQLLAQDNSRAMISIGSNNDLVFGAISAPFSNNYFGWLVGGGGANNLVHVPSLGTASKQLVEMVFDGTATGNASRFKALLAGVDQATNLTFEGTIPSALGADGKLSFGGSDGGGSLVSCDIQEVLIYDQTLSAEDRSLIRVALGAKAGISVTA